MNAVIDMGGTNTRIGLSDDMKEFFVIEKFPTPHTKEETHKQIAKFLSVYLDKIETIIFGVAGFVNYKEKIVQSSPNIKWISNMTAIEIIGIDNKNIHLYNDAELAGLAEADSSYGSKYKNVAYITISTGVGGTIVRDKRPATHSYNYEPGHIIIDISSEIDPVDGIYGSFESLCSGTAFRKRYGIAPEDCHDNDKWIKYGHNLADGLYTLTLLWQPEAIVLGGSMTNQWDYFSDAMMQRYTSYPTYYAHPIILKSELKDMNGLMGGLRLLQSH